jgi:hypothetical protein
MRKYCEFCDYCYFHSEETHLLGKRHAKALRSSDGTCFCKTNCTMGPEGHTPRRERAEMKLLATGTGGAKVAALFLVVVAAYYLNKYRRSRHI